MLAGFSLHTHRVARDSATARIFSLDARSFVLLVCDSRHLIAMFVYTSCCMCVCVCVYVSTVVSPAAAVSSTHTGLTFSARRERSC
jgi:hypothetical protein